MNKPRNKAMPPLRPALVCGSLLFLATLSLAQHALDANLRVGSGGYNARRPQVTMSRSIYKVSSSGGMYYNRGAAFNSPEVYNSAISRQGRRPDIFKPTPLGRTSANASSLARARYSPGLPARSAGQTQIVRSVRRPKSSATLQRSGYTPGRALSAMQAPSLNLSQKAYSVRGTASGTVRSR